MERGFWARGGGGRGVGVSKMSTVSMSLFYLIISIKKAYNGNLRTCVSKRTRPRIRTTPNLISNSHFKDSKAGKLQCICNSQIYDTFASVCYKNCDLLLENVH